jgi:hypothetical protein
METAIWALAYLRLGALNSFSDALFYVSIRRRPPCWAMIERA